MNSDDVALSLGRFLRAPLGDFPSPVKQARLQNGQWFWIKDDGNCSDTYGGNKVRKLEYLFAWVQQHNKRSLIVHGDVESHTVQACGLLGRKMGLEIDAVVFPHRGQSFNALELFRLRQMGVRLHLRRNMLTAMLHAHLLGWRKRGFVVPLGASTSVATLGYVRAALELRDQVREGLLPQPRRIYIPFATGGSVAGLLIGLALAGVPPNVVAVQTVEGIIANRWRLERLVKRTLALLGKKQADFHRCMNQLALIDDRYLGKGYRDVPVKTMAAVAEAAKHGIHLEPTFSGKAFAALLDALPEFPNGEILFWNTHDQRREFANAGGRQ